ncbi:murein biosynthesis integral membrane protein MurJ [Gorillibacterium sp. sgz5001074]|uniref:murein biosynthesis integral membrane protein MurJ n=1 Tax=Gorillibacterium sp. sgz5001074 TaxID=3446695 RepID=UPI003F66E9B8
MAGYYGTSDELDAFLVAFVVPLFVLNILTSSFNGSLIPTYIRVKMQEGLVPAKKLLVTFIIVNFIGLAVVVALLYLLGAPMIHQLYSSFSEEKLELTLRLYWGLIPVIFFSGMGSCFTAVLNANEHYKLVSWVTITSPLVIISFLLWKGANVDYLVYGTLIGVIFETCLLFLYTLKLRLLAPLKWYGLDHNIREVAKQYFPMIVGSILLGNMTIVDQTMAATLDEGSVAILSYGGKIISLVAGVFALALSSVLLPHVSKLAANKEWISLKEAAKKHTLYILLFSIPIMYAIILSSDWIVRILFERGEFAAADTNRVSIVQRCLAVQIPFYIAGIFGSRLLSALNHNSRMMWINIGSLIFNIVLNYIFMRPLGVAGIALSTSFVYFISSVLIFTNVFLIVQKKSQEMKGQI